MASRGFVNVNYEFLFPIEWAHCEVFYPSCLLPCTMAWDRTGWPENGLFSSISITTKKILTLRVLLV
jgi:hypothetical protein